MKSHSTLAKWGRTCLHQKCTSWKSKARCTTKLWTMHACTLGVQLAIDGLYFWWPTTIIVVICTQLLCLNTDLYLFWFLLLTTYLLWSGKRNVYERCACVCMRENLIEMRLCMWGRWRLYCKRRESRVRRDVQVVKWLPHHCHLDPLSQHPL